jgi:hypothetical protein
MTATALNILQNEQNPVFQAWVQILKHSPTQTWQQPILTFIDSFKKIKLSKENIDQCNFFMCNLARYIYAKQLADEPNVGLTIKQEMLRVVEIAKQGKIYEPKLKINRHFNLPRHFKQKLNEDIPKNIQWGLCAIVEMSRNFDKLIERITNLKPKKTISQILETSTIEQIFPNKWDSNFSNRINKWNDEKIKRSLQKIGNFALIEQEIHKTTSKIWKGNFFEKKRIPDQGKGYDDSVFNELSMYNQILDGLNGIDWIYGFYQDRQKQCLYRLTDFFSGLSDEPIMI